MGGTFCLCNKDVLLKTCHDMFCGMQEFMAPPEHFPPALSIERKCFSLSSPSPD